MVTDRPQHEVGALSLRLQVIQNHLIKRRLVASGGYRPRRLATRDGGVVGIDWNLDGAGQAFHASDLNSLHNGPMLPLHEGRDGFAVHVLGQEIVVRRAAGIEDLAAGVDQRLNQRVGAAFVLGLYVVGGAAVFDVRVEPCQNHGAMLSSNHQGYRDGARRSMIKHVVPGLRRGYNPLVSQPRLLFVCVGNSCRSIMAEAIARSLAGRRIVAASAGLAPAGFVADATIRILEAHGYETAGLWSKGLHALDAEPFDVVVSLLGRRGVDLLPRALGHRVEAWDLRDPFGEDESTYRQVLRDIETRVRRLLDREIEGELPRP